MASLKLGVIGFSLQVLLLQALLVSVASAQSNELRTGSTIMFTKNYPLRTAIPSKTTEHLTALLGGGDVRLVAIQPDEHSTADYSMTGYTECFLSLRKSATATFLESGHELEITAQKRTEKWIDTLTGAVGASVMATANDPIVEGVICASRIDIVRYNSRRIERGSEGAPSDGQIPQNFRRSQVLCIKGSAIAPCPVDKSTDRGTSPNLPEVNAAS
ncbi:MAG: hypothetical protein ACXVA9_13175 [Bdellovibrionales bacterium]